MSSDPESQVDQPTGRWEAAGEGRSPAAQLAALGVAAGRGGPIEDPPRWHLAAAEEAMDEGRWDVARAALERARENAAPGSNDLDEASFTAVRLAVSTLDLRSASSEVAALVARMPAADPVWARRVRALLDGAPPIFPPSVREGLIELLPPVPLQADAGTGDAAVSVPRIPIPVDGLPPLDDEDPWLDEGPANDAAAEGLLAPPEAADALRPIPTSSPFSTPRLREDDGALVRAPARADREREGPPREAAFDGRVIVPAATDDLTDADALREKLVEDLLARVGDAEVHVLFETASTFLNNGQFDTAEILFAGAMQLPELRVPACEGQMQALVGAGRYDEAAALATRTLRLFAREGDALLGVVYWNAVAAQYRGDVATARMGFVRIAESAHAPYFPDVASRLDALR